MDGTGGGVIAATGWDLPEIPVVPDPRTARARFEFVGASPYIADAMSEDRILAIVGDTMPKMPEAPDGMTDAARGVWERQWYREHVAPHCIERRDGRPGIPARNFLRCLIEAGAYERDRRMAKLTDATGSRVPGLVRIEEDFLVFPNDDWTLDVRRGERRRRKVKIARAMFPQWGFAATIAFDPNRLSAERLHHLIWVAGYRVGLGGFRKDPRRGHIRAVFGRFKIERWDVLTGDATAERAA